MDFDRRRGQAVTGMVICVMLFLLLMSLSERAFAADSESSESRIWRDDATGLELEYYPNESLMVSSVVTVPEDGVVRIPDEIDGRPVRQIGAKGFQNNKEITELYLPDSIEYFYSETFMRCSNLRKVRLPEGLEEIAQDLFRECTSLEEITIPDTVQKIGARAFYMCTSLKSVVLPRDLQTIDSSMLPFEGCTAIESFTVSGDSRSFSSEDGVLFSKDKSILYLYPPAKTDPQAYTVPASVAELAYGAFRNARLRSLVLPEGLEAIPDYAFFGMGDLESIRIPDSVKTIGAYSFGNTQKLTELKLPNGLKSIGAHAFDYCHITSIRIPSGIESIGVGAFRSSWIESIRWPESVPEIKAVMFSQTPVLQYIYIPDTVTTLDVTAIRWARSLKALYVPASVTTFSNGVSDSIPFNTAINGETREFTLYGETGSAIESYAKEYELPFVAMTREEFESGVKDGTLPGYVEEKEEESGGSGSNGESGGKGENGQGQSTEGSDPSGDTDTDSGKSSDSEISDSSGSGGGKTGTASGGKTSGTGTGTGKSGVTSGGRTSGKTDDTSKGSGTGGKKAARRSQKITGPASSYKLTTNSKAFKLGAKASTKLRFTSSNKKVVKVSSAGKVKVVGPGKATITMKAAKTAKYKSAVRKVRVKVTLAKPELKAKNLKGGKVKLTWTKSDAADGYMLYVKVPGEKEFVNRLTKNARVKSVTHKGLSLGQRYQYKVRAFKKVGNKTYYSGFSKVADVRVEK